MRRKERQKGQKDKKDRKTKRQKNRKKNLVQLQSCKIIVIDDPSFESF